MRKNKRKTLTLKCDICQIEFLKFKKEYDRKIRNKKTKFYCTRSCAAKGNPALAEKVKYNKEHPQEINAFLLKFPRKKRTTDELSPFRTYIRKIKNRISRIGKDKEINITPEYLKIVWENQRGICPYTGIPMIVRNFNQPSQPHSASIDRIDSSQGYIEGNVEFVCMSINFAKNDFSKEEMLSFVQKIKEQKCQITI